MKKAPRLPLGAIAAAVLAGLTLSVFFRLQDYGPESAVLRFSEIIRNAPDYSFHDQVRLRGQGLDAATVRFFRAIGNDGAADLQKVSVGVIPTPEVRRPSADVIRWLTFLKDRFTAGARVRIGVMDRKPDEVRAYVKFPYPNELQTETELGMVWVVVRRGKTWFVDANQTAIIFADSQGGFH